MGLIVYVSIFEEVGEDRLPSVMQCDNCPAFVNNTFKGWLEGKGIRIIHSSQQRLPTSNGKAERLVRSLSNWVTSSSAAHHNDSVAFWPKYLAMACKYYNRTTQERLKGKSPKELWERGGPIDENIVQRLREKAANSRNSRIYDKTLKPGDKIILSYRVSPETSSLMKQTIVNRIRKRYLQNFSPTVYTINRYVGNGRYTIVELPGRQYDRVDMRPVPVDQLQRI